MTRKRVKQIASALAAAGIAFNGVLSSDVVALADALESGSTSAMNSFISKHPDSEYVGDAIIHLAGFKPPGDHGRPGAFGPPGPPLIGPPGQYKA